jgi:cell division transport system permease protein
MPKASQFLLLKRALQLSLSNLVRNKLLSIATILVIGITLFIFNIILAINFIAESSLQNLSEKVDITLYLKESTSQAQTQKIIDELKILDGITDVNHTSKDEALTKIKATYPNIYESFQKYDLGNPLPASISITTKEPSYHEAIENFIKGSQFSLYVSNIQESPRGTSQEKSILSSVTQNLKKVTDFSHQIVFWLVITFIIGGVLIIFNAVQMTIFNRRKEINVMRLVGSNISFIHLPFIIEAILYAVLAILINLLLLTLLSKQINFDGTSLYEFSENLNLTALTIFELIITVILAVCSSILSVHSYLKK